jgi:hypothetical protein
MNEVSTNNNLNTDLTYDITKKLLSLLVLKKVSKTISENESLAINSTNPKVNSHS